VPKSGHADPLVNKAEKAITRRAFDEALVMLKQAVDNPPKDPDALWRLAELYDKHLDYPGRAADAYAGFRDRFPADPRHAEAERRAARLQRETRTPGQPPAPAPADDARTLLEEGLQHYRRNDWDGAIARYRSALGIQKDFADAWYNLGFAYKAKGDTERARSAFESAVRVRPGMLKAQYMLAVVYRKLGKRDEGIELLRIVLKTNPDYAKAHLLLGLLLRESNRPDLAEGHLRKYVKLAPEEPAANDVRKWLAESGEPSAAD